MNWEFCLNLSKFVFWITSLSAACLSFQSCWPRSSLELNREIFQRWQIFEKFQWVDLQIFWYFWIKRFASGVAIVSPTLTSTPIFCLWIRLDWLLQFILLILIAFSANDFVDSPGVEDWLSGARLEGFPGVVADSVHFVCGSNTGDNRPVCPRAYHLVTFRWFRLLIEIISGIMIHCWRFHDWNYVILNYWSWLKAAHPTCKLGSK